MEVMDNRQLRLSHYVTVKCEVNTGVEKMNKVVLFLAMSVGNKSKVQIL